MKRIYHYTRSSLVEDILEAGEIKPATAFTKPWELPVVWLSNAKEWEHAASTTDTTTKSLWPFEAIAQEDPLVRFEIDPLAVNTISQPKVRQILKTWESFSSSLGDEAKSQSADPHQWMAVKGNIPLSACVRIEIATSANPWNWSKISFKSPSNCTTGNSTGDDGFQSREHEKPATDDKKTASSHSGTSATCGNLVHLTLNTGHSFTRPLAILRPVDLRLLTPIVYDGGGFIPNFSPWRCVIAQEDGIATFDIRRNVEDVVTFNMVAWTIQGAQKGKKMLKDLYTSMLSTLSDSGAITTPEMPEIPDKLPWLATLILPTAPLYAKSSDLKWMADFEGCLASTIIIHHLNG
ncbi:MAG: hypothetical protein ACSHX7_00240 [Luteolibacter sp.]